MIKINVYSQYFTVTMLNFSKLIFDLHEFNKNLITYKLVLLKTGRGSMPKVSKVIDRVLYIIETKTEENSSSKNQIRYPISVKDDLLLYLKDRIDKSVKISIVNNDYVIGDDVQFSINQELTPKVHQVAYTDIVTKTKKEKILIDLQTGQGKTFIASRILGFFGKRFAIVILPRYLDKWISDVLYLTDIKREEILIIQGITSVIKAVKLGREGMKDYKCVIISLTTISSYIKGYLNNTLGDDTLSPETLFDDLGVDTVLNDESHQEFFSFYRLMLFSNNRLTLGLTATLEHKDEDITMMYDIGFPKYSRISNILPYNKYIHVISVRYNFRNRNKIRYKSNFGYNQPIFEKSLIMNSHVLINYMNMIDDILSPIYIRRREKGQKALIFMGTVKMCSLGESYFKKRYPHLNVCMYTEKEDYSIIEKADIICSTVPSAGTALDISGLISVIQTVNIDSISANTQTLGRLREIKGTKVIFAYLWASDIPPHKKYNRNRLMLFNKLAKSVQMRDYNKII